MKLKEIIVDWICESSLFEMAHERKKAIDQVRGLQFPLSNHLVKILYLNLPDTINHWISEVNGYLTIMDQIRVKGGNPKNLKPNDYKLLLWEEPLGHGVSAVRQIIKHFKRDYNGVQNTGLTEYQVYEILYKIYSDLIYDIPNDKFEDIRDYLRKHANLNV